jgi:hypothetical protein
MLSHYRTDSLLHIQINHRVYYGPDSSHAEFEADTCSEILGEYHVKNNL